MKTDVPITTTIVTVDGTAGAGKSTAAIGLRDALEAKNRDAIAINTGSLLRGMACLLLSEQEVHLVKPHHKNTAVHLVILAMQNGLDFHDGQAAMNGAAIPEEILRDEMVTSLTKDIAVLPGVRGYLNSRVQNCIQTCGARFIIIEGRNGGREFPDAIKFFLTIDSEVAAKRLGTTVEAIEARNKKDAEREIAPMIPTEDADKIDTTKFSKEQVVDKLLEMVG